MACATSSSLTATTSSASRRTTSSASCFGNAASHAVGEHRRHRRRDDPAGAERVEIRGRMRRDDAHQRAGDAGMGPRRRRGEKARTQADRHEHHVGFLAARKTFEELHPVGHHAPHQVAMERRHHVQALLAPPARWRVRAPPGNRRRAPPASAPSARMAAFFSTELPCGTTMVAVQAGTARRQCHRLAVVAARGADHAAQARPPRARPLEIGEPAADLEGAGRRVVLVLDPDRHAQPLRAAAARRIAAWATWRHRPSAVTTPLPREKTS